MRSITLIFLVAIPTFAQNIALATGQIATLPLKAESIELTAKTEFAACITSFGKAHQPLPLITERDCGCWGLGKQVSLDCASKYAEPWLVIEDRRGAEAISSLLVALLAAAMGDPVATIGAGKQALTAMSTTTITMRAITAPSASTPTARQAQSQQSRPTSSNQ